MAASDNWKNEFRKMLKKRKEKRVRPILEMGKHCLFGNAYFPQKTVKSFFFFFPTPQLLFANDILSRALLLSSVYLKEKISFPIRRFPNN